MIVAIGRRYGKVDQSRSPVVTWARWSCFVRDAQKRSRGLWRCQALKSATCGPSTVTMRQSWPARTGQARPERIGTTKRSTSVRAAVSLASRS